MDYYQLDGQLGAVAIIFLFLNVAAFILMFVDKLKAGKNNTERISEGMLFFLAAAFGSIGVCAGMFAFRHKTQKWYFIIGIPLLVIQNLAFLYLTYLYLVGK